jgi:epoxyqueuosine reductase
VGICAPEPGSHDRERLARFLAGGLPAALAWMARDPDRRADPRRSLEGCRSVVALALDYDSDAPRSIAVPTHDADGAPLGWVSRYAWGDDYHDVIPPMLHAFMTALRAEVGPDVGLRAYSDTGPVMEKALAQRAGLGWQGKHTNLVHPQRGSFFFLAVVLTTLELEPDEPTPDHCGRCTRCVDACPTGALATPYALDASRCIATLTIEQRGELPPEARPLIGRHLFGCDICQDVCPFNRFSPPGHAAFAPRPHLLAPRLTDFRDLDEPTYQRWLKGSPLKRRKREGLMDNARAGLANVQPLGPTRPPDARGGGGRSCS